MSQQAEESDSSHLKHHKSSVGTAAESTAPIHFSLSGQPKNPNRSKNKAVTFLSKYLLKVHYEALQFIDSSDSKTNETYLLRITSFFM